MDRGSGKFVFGVDNQRQVEHDHVHVHPLVVVGDFLQVVVALGLYVLFGVDVVQALKGQLLQLVDLLVDGFPVALLDDVGVRDGVLQPHNRVLEVDDEVVLALEETALHLFDQRADFHEFHHFGVVLVHLEDDEFAPEVQQSRVLIGLLLAIQMFEVFREDPQELLLHQEVPHCLDQPVMPSRGQQHVVNLLLPQRQNDGDNQDDDQVHQQQQLGGGVESRGRVYFQWIAHAFHDIALMEHVLVPEVVIVHERSDNVDEEDHLELFLHGVSAVDIALHPDAVDQYHLPEESSAEFAEDELDVLVVFDVLGHLVLDGEAEVRVAFVEPVADDDDGAQGCHRPHNQGQHELFLEYLERPRLIEAAVHLVGVHDPHAPHEVQDISSVLEPGLDGPEPQAHVHLPKDGSEVVGGVDHGVDDELAADAHDDHDAEDGGLLLEGVVVLEDEPLQAHLDAAHDDEDHPEDAEVDLEGNGLLAGVVDRPEGFAAAEDVRAREGHPLH